MKNIRTLTPIFGLLAMAVHAFAQTPPAAPRPAAAPRPMIAPTPMAEPMPAAAPMPAVAPMAPLAYIGDAEMQEARAMVFSADMQDKIDAAREQAERAREQMRYQVDNNLKFEFNNEMRFEFENQIAAAKDMAYSVNRNLFAFAPQVAPKTMSPMPPTAPMPAKAYTLRMSDDRLYSAGQSALDNRQWEQALEYFSQAVTRNTSRVDGALYWKAYALGRMGRRDEANASIAELRKSFASSRWLDDAKALELELRQASGQSVSPEAESDEELKLMAINGLMQSDPERAIPLLEGQLKGSASPKVKRNTLFVLAQSSSPKAQALVEQIARGGANPDLQLKAISYMDSRRKPANAQMLSEIYASTNDVAVKRAILQSFSGMRDKDRLMAAARTEKTPELREIIIGGLSGNQGTPELWQLYQTETTPEGKLQILRFMYNNSDAAKLLEVVKNEKDPKVRGEAVRVLASQKTGVDSNAMVAIYNAEQDAKIKSSILDNLMGQRNAKAMIEIIRQEKDQRIKLRIVERLSNMKGSKEAQDYLEELLKK